jgi:phytoene desaturase
MTRSVGIIGAGPGGLAAAMLLARAGAKVTVHERLDRLGGRSGTIAAETPHGRFRFDMGPTFFLYPAVLAEIFAACGACLDDHVDLMRLDPQYHLVFEAGGEIRATPDLPRLMQEVAKLAPADAQALPRFMADNRAKLAAFSPVLQNEFDRLRDYVRPSMLRSLPLLRPQRTVDSDLASYFADPRVRLAFSFQSKYLGMSPFSCPSLFTILSFLEYEFGVFHPRGGTGSVMSAMARVAEDMGVRIQLGDPVQEMLFEGKRAVGVRTRHGEQRYDAVVVNADFAQAMKTLVPDRLRRRWTDRKLEGKKFSCSTFMMYLGIEGRYDDLAHHTIYLSEDYKRNIAEIEQGRAPPGEPSFYVQNASVTDPSLAPSGHSTLYVLVPVAHRVGEGIDWTAERARFRALTLQRLERIGITGLEERIRFEKILTPAGWEHDMQIFRGATFNLSHALRQMLYFRPHNRFEDLDRVYLVGGGTHPGSGLPVIFESARITAKLMAQDLGLTADFPVEAPVAPRVLEPAIAEVS